MKRSLPTVVAASILFLGSTAARAANFTVISSADSGRGTLRQAILDANDNPGADTVSFSLPTTGGSAAVIGLGTVLPDITEQLTIDGYTQAGSSANTNSTGALNTVLKVVVDGSDLPNSPGISIASTSNCVIRGLNIRGFDLPVFIYGNSTGNVISGNFLGTDEAGVRDATDSFANVLIDATFFGTIRRPRAVAAAADNVIGGTTAAARNLISGSGGDGIYIFGADAVTVQGNLIGTNAAGTADLGNDGNGIYLDGTTNCHIGGAGALGNVIAANGSNGVRLINNSTGNLIQGNKIGTTVSGLSALGNSGSGIDLASGSNTVGGSTGSLGNVLAANNAGITIASASNSVLSNNIGVGADGSTPLGNSGSGGGIFISGSTALGNIIGLSGQGNVIGANDSSGIAVQNGAGNTSIRGNIIGLAKDGTTIRANGDGIDVAGAVTCNIGGANTGDGNLISGNDFNGINVRASATSVIIQGNKIGTDTSGDAAKANDVGIRLSDVFAVQIGGSSAATRNLISGNQQGIVVEGTTSTSNTIIGNYIGTNAAGTGAVANSIRGISIESGANNNVVGGTTAAAGNLISGNTGIGLVIDGSGSSSNAVFGNRIGCSASGTTLLANGVYGIALLNGAQNNSIGASTAVTGSAPGNVIGGNASAEILLGGSSTGNNTIAGNLIGTNAAGTSALKANRSSGNGVQLIAAGGRNLVGGTTAGDRNVISGSDTGVLVNATSLVTVRGNYIGTDINGSTAIPNRVGVIFLNKSDQGLVGGTTSTPGQNGGNVISGNEEYGIHFGGNTTGSDANNSSIVGNIVGLDKSGAAKLPNHFAGIAITDDSSSVVVGGTATNERNVISGNDGYGVFLGGAATANNLIQGNYIGTDINGTAALGNNFAGVLSEAGGTGNNIGGSTAGARNVISGNAGSGIELSSTVASHSIQNNYIGIGATGKVVLANNGFGISLSDTWNAVIGGAGSGNVIGGNGDAGIRIVDSGEGAGAQSNSIVGNFIGVSSDGTTKLGNVSDGVRIDGSNNTVGSVADSKLQNLILNNGGNGIVVQGGTGNRLRGNGISGNTLLGINLQNPATEAAGLPTANDATDADSGPNNLTNFPVISKLDQKGSTLSVEFTLQAAANSSYVFDVYVSTAPDVSGFGEGETYLGSSSTVSTNASGATGTQTLTFSGDYSGKYISMVATDVAGNSSEFSQSSQVGAVTTGNFVVNTNVDTDDGTCTTATNGCTLREAINAANGRAGADTIEFNIPGTNLTITPGTALPVIREAVTIDGYTQPGSKANTLAVGTDAILKIELRGGTGATQGLVCTAPNTTIRGLVINNFSGSGVIFTDNTVRNSKLVGCYIGTNAAGSAANGTPAAFAVIVQDGATANSIGGVAPADRNVISGNACAIGLFQGPSATSIVNNYIGVGASGNTKIGNSGPGILLSAAAANTLIGGTTNAARNVISGNETGISIDDAGTDNNQVVGNYVGLSADGNQVFGHTKVGIEVTSGAQKNVIGGTTAGAGNTIVGAPIGVNLTGNNTSNTISNTVAGNFIGTDAAGNKTLNGTKLGNTIGVKVEQGAKSNLIGGTTTAARNVIGGNLFGGVVLNGEGTSSNTVAGNFIGLSTAGLALGNGDFAPGVTLTAGANGNTIGGNSAASRNVISGQSDGSGILIEGSGTNGNTVAGNYIGVTPAGDAALANSRGVNINSGAKNNIVGGLTSGERNVISGCEFAVGISGSGTTGNQVRGNYLGTNAAGTLAIANRFGVGIGDGASGNVIGGTNSGALNLISGNTDGNIYINGANSNTVAGNYIGTNSGGTASLGAFTTSASVILTGGASGNTIGGASVAARNIISGSQGHGVEIQGSEIGSAPFTNGNTVAGNYIGTDVTGAIAVPNRGSGIYIVASARNNLIGGTTAAAMNLISGNLGSGVQLEGTNTTGNVISANRIGTDLTGTKALGNVDGIQITGGASQTTIGGLTSGERNLISGNGRIIDGRGVQIIGPASKNNTVVGNYIGTNAAGTAALGNGDEGVYLNDAPNNVVGGTTASARNVIAGNGTFSIGSAGVAIIGANASGNRVQGNYVGTNAAGSTAIGNVREGIYVNGSNNTIAGNLCSGNLLEGIRVSTMLGDTTTGNVIRGNLVGTNAAGTAAIANGFGIRVDGTVSKTTVGGSSAAERNLISGNSASGLILAGPGTTVTGNYIGVDITGTKALGNQGNGIELQDGAAGNMVGGAAIPAGSGVGNIVSANRGDGFAIESDSASGNRFQGNIIGSDLSGTLDLGNGGHGISVSGASDNNFGGVGTGAANLIAYSGKDGAEVSGLAMRARFRGNLYIGNSGLPLNLRPENEGASISTPNDALDPDSGPNNLQNFPILTRAVTSGSSVNIRGTLNTNPNGKFNVDLYKIIGAEPEVRRFLATAQIGSDAGGNGTFNFSVAGKAGDRFVTMVSNLKGNSSEFGAPIAATEVTTLALGLEMDSPVREGVKTAYHGRVLRPAGSTGAAVNVNLTASRAGQLNLPAVRIPASATSADFEFFVIDNTNSQADRTVAVTARAAGYTDGTADVLVLDDDPSGGQVFAWGYNEYGQVGNASTSDRAIPVAVLSDALTVAGNGSHSLAVAGDGTVRSWGYNGAGQLGDGTQTNRSRPVTVSGLTNVLDVAAGWYHSLALKSDGTVWGWGFNSEGQIGDGTTTRRLTPVRVQGLPKKITAISAGVYFSLALDVDGEVWAWGSNTYGQLGDGTKISRKLPVKVQIPAAVKAIAAGGGHSLFLKGNGSVWSCGWNNYGQLGQGSNAEVLTPVRLANLTGCSSIAAGYAHSLALDGAGTVYGWGDNSYGQIGARVSGKTSIPTEIKALTGVNMVLAGADFSLCVQSGGQLLSLGNNNHRQLGNNSAVAKSDSPVNVFYLQKVARASAAYGHGLSIAEAAPGGALKPLLPSSKTF